MKIIDHIKKDPTEIVKEVVYTRRIPLDSFPLFTQKDPLEVIVRYLDASKKDRTTQNIDIQNLPQLPETHITKTKKRKVVGEGAYIKTPKAAKKQSTSSFISVVESILLSTYEPPSSPKPYEHHSPQTFDKFDTKTNTSTTTNQFRLISYILLILSKTFLKFFVTLITMNRQIMLPNQKIQILL